MGREGGGRGRKQFVILVAVAAVRQDQQPRYRREQEPPGGSAQPAPGAGRLATGTCRPYLGLERPGRCCLTRGGASEGYVPRLCLGTYPPRLRLANRREPARFRIGTKLGGA